MQFSSAATHYFARNKDDHLDKCQATDNWLVRYDVIKINDQRLKVKVNDEVRGLFFFSGELR